MRKDLSRWESHIKHANLKNLRSKRERQYVQVLKSKDSNPATLYQTLVPFLSALLTFDK